MIPSERSINNTKRLFPEMKQGKMNLVQGEGERGQLRMTKETTKTLAQGRKGRDRRLIVLDRHQLKFLRRCFHGLMPRLIENFSNYVSIGRITVSLGKDIMTHQQLTGKLRVPHHCFRRTSDSTVFCFRCWKEKALGVVPGEIMPKSLGVHIVPEEGRRRYVDRIKTLSSSRGEEGLFGHKFCIARSLNDTKHQITVETCSLPTSPTAENRVAEALKNEMQDSTVEEDEDSAVLIASRHVRLPRPTIWYNEVAIYKKKLAWQSSLGKSCRQK